MEMEQLFTVALGLGTQWKIKKVDFLMDEGGKRELHLHLGYEKGERFTYEGKKYPVYDHQRRKWRHLNFFEHECHLHADVPRVKADDGTTSLVDVPWASPGSSFTLLFQAYAVMLIQGGMSFSRAGRYMGIDGRRIFTIVERRVVNALQDQELENVEHLAVDETSSKKGHNYLTVLTDVKRKKVVGVAAGKDTDAMKSAMLDMEIRGSDRKKVRVVTLDMSPAYISGCAEMMPKARMVFDRFHIEMMMNKAVDSVRREEAKQCRTLRGCKYTFLRNQERLSYQKKEELQRLSDSFPTLGKAHRLKEQLKVILDRATITRSVKDLTTWTTLAWRSEIPQVRKVVNTRMNHWYGIKTYFRYCVSNGYAERVNLKIQEIKRLARGFRNPHNFKTMIYFHLGKLELGLPTKYC